MKVHEAIELIRDGKTWARPCWWRGSGVAVVVQRGGRLVTVPSPHGGSMWGIFIEDMLDDWEVVSSEVVLEERTHLDRTGTIYMG